MTKHASLTPFQRKIMEEAGTEAPFSGGYDSTTLKGTYVCRRCGRALFRSHHKFSSSCGWPSFDDEIAGRLTRCPDPDGRRTEIVCSTCQAHLGHVFHSEGLTSKNVRHCVNAVALDFVPSETVEETEEGFFAGGCFWGVEHAFSKLSGVLLTQVGYMGGKSASPSYQDVCTGTTGHRETVRVLYDPQHISYETLLKHFFSLHDGTQEGHQGPDVGGQYQSTLFYYNESQKEAGRRQIDVLIQEGYDIRTQCCPVSIFWPAEEDHQGYIRKKGI